jgi:nitrite reductase/ring-hydroxylating ferredoxin subunit
MKRREFLSNTSKILCACTISSGVSIIQSCTNNVVMPSEEGEELVINLELEEYNPLLQDGGSIVIPGNIIDSQGLLLFRTGDTIKAYTNNCTHSGYDLTPFQNGVSTCVSGHGGKFNTNGNAISGPANGSLKEYDTEMNQNILTISK